MADNYAICTLLGAMDHLWFHQIILFPNSVFPPKSPKTPLPFSESFTSYQSASSCTSIPEEHGLLSSDESAITPQQDNDYEIEETEKIIQDNDDSEIEEREKIIEVLKKTRPSRLNIVKTHSNSSSPSSTPNKLSKSRRRYSGSVMRLQKTMSCKSLSELEVEEVQGFMDLGFRFDTEHLCPRMMSVVPGLQRLGSCNSILQKDMLDDKVLAINNNKDDDHEIEEDVEKSKRPYLSEAWLIRRPDCPLLNLRIPRASAAADMKEHLKHWARTVASVIQQES